MNKWKGLYESDSKGILYYLGITTINKGEIEIFIDDSDSFISTASIIRYEDCGSVKKGKVIRENGSRKFFLDFEECKMTLWITRWTSEEIIGVYSFETPYYDQGSFKLIKENSDYD